MRRLVLLLLVSVAPLMAGCLAGPSASQAPAPEPPAPAAAAPVQETLYFDYSNSEQACLEMEGLLVPDRPERTRACWHLPDELGTRSYAGPAARAWMAGSPLQAVLEVYGQAPTTSAFDIVITADGAQLARETVDLGVLTPVEGDRDVVLRLETAAAFAAGAEVRVTFEHTGPTTFDYLVVGDSRIVFG